MTIVVCYTFQEPFEAAVQHLKVRRVKVDGGIKKWE